MTESSSTLSIFSKGWNDYLTLLTKAIEPLTPDQLSLRAAPGLRSPGEIATHMIGARARWFHEVMNEGDQAFAALGMWDSPGMPVRSAAELVSGLETTWRVMQDALAHWSASDLEYTFKGEHEGEAYALTRGWIVWHLIEHDLHHGGEISLTLGMHGLMAPDI